MIGYILLAILALSVISYAIGRRRAVASVEGRQSELHSRPNYHGAFVAAWVGIPAFLLVLVWLALQGPVIDRLLLWSLPIGTTDGMDTGQISLLLSEIKSVAAGNIFGEPSLLVQEAAERYQRWQTIARYAMIAAVFSVALLGLAVAAGRISPEFRARHGTERAARWAGAQTKPRRSRRIDPALAERARRALEGMTGATVKVTDTRVEIPFADEVALAEIVESLEAAAGS